MPVTICPDLGLMQYLSPVLIPAFLRLMVELVSTVIPRHLSLTPGDPHAI